MRAHRVVGRITEFTVGAALAVTMGLAHGADPIILSVDLTHDRAISDFIYCVNVANWSPTHFQSLVAPKLKDAGVSAVRMGGTNVERYNFQTNRLFNVISRRNDYVPMSWESFVDWTRNDLGAEPILQISVYGHVAGPGERQGDVDYDHIQTTGEVEAWVRSAGSKVRLWEVGNEPDIAWKRPDFPADFRDSAHGDQVLNRDTAYDRYFPRFMAVAAAVKQANPAALVIGPSVANWYYYWRNDYSPYVPVTTPNGDPKVNDPAWSFIREGKNTWNAAVFPDRGTDPAVSGWEENPQRFLPQFAQRMRAYEASTGVRIADGIDVHRYIRPASDKDALQEIRGLWDPDFQSWGDAETSYRGDVTKVLVRLQNIVDRYYPGTALSFSEYDYFYWNGYPKHPQVAAVGQMDFLGTFGRMGVALACNWYVGEPNQSGAGYHHASDSSKQALFNEKGEPNPKYWAFWLMSHHYRERALATLTSDSEKFSVHASRRSDGTVRVIVAYKGAFDATGAVVTDTPPQTATLALNGESGALQVTQAYRFGSDDPYPVELDKSRLSLSGGRLSYAFEPLAIYVFVLGPPASQAAVSSMLHVNPARIDFGPYETGTTTDESGKVTYTVPLKISNGRPDGTRWAISGGASWLKWVGAANGTAKTTDLGYLTVDRQGLAIGRYTATLTVTTSEGPQTVPVTLDVAKSEADGERRISDFDTGSLAHAWNDRPPYSLGWGDGHGIPEDRNAPYIYSLTLDYADTSPAGGLASLKVAFDRSAGDTDGGRRYLPFVTYGHSSSVVNADGSVTSYRAGSDWTGYTSLKIDIKAHTDGQATTPLLLVIADENGNIGKPQLGTVAYNDTLTLDQNVWQTLSIPLAGAFYDWRYPDGQNGSLAKLDFSRINQIEFMPWPGSDDKRGVLHVDNIRLVKETRSVTPRLLGNGAQGSVRLMPDTAITVTAGLDAGDHAAEPGDWWLYAETPFGLFHYAQGAQGWNWYSGDGISYQGMVGDFSNLPILSLPGLPQGVYTLHFAIDLNRNGVRDAPVYEDILTLDVR